MTANLRPKDAWNPGPVTIVDGVLQRRGNSESLTVSSSDPRIAGVWSYVENRDDQGGWAPREKIIKALETLGLLPVEEDQPLIVNKPNR